VAGGVEGTLYEAEYVGPGSGRPTRVALKEYRIHPDAAPNWPHDGTWLQISDQAALLAGLRSDHLVQVREVFLGAVTTMAMDGQITSTRKAFETPYVEMEWIEGRLPGEVLRFDRPSLSVRLGWISDLAEAVEVLGSVTQTSGNPLVHGDIKPANCLISSARGLVLIDTGALHRAAVAGNRRGLRSPPFAAPEVLDNPGSHRTTATDLYSLGAVALYFLTGQSPPSADRADYLEEARAIMASSGWVTGRPPAAALAGVTDHVMRLLNPDPRVRMATSARDWAAGLERMLAGPQRGTGRGPTLLAACALATAVTIATVVVVNTGSDQAGHAPRASDPASTSTAPLPSTPVDSTRSPTAPGPSVQDRHVLYSTDFSDASPRWPATKRDEYETRYTAGMYAVHATARGGYFAVPSPSRTSLPDEVVTARAAIESGQGAWGLWCRGTDAAGTERYEFLLSHAGAVQILEPDGSSTGWKYLADIDVSEPVTMAARCDDVPGAPVVLTLSVNGRVALTYEPKGQLLGPGFAGIETMSFSDVSGPVVRADFSHFAIERPN
jgi:serine/threonine protein kinase